MIQNVFTFKEVEQRFVNDRQNYEHMSLHFKALSESIFTTCSYTN